MKDAFFKIFDKFYNFIYRMVLRITYLVLTFKRCRSLSSISRKDRQRIENYWKKTYGKKIPLFEYKWFRVKDVNLDERLIPDVIWHSVIEPYYTNLQMIKGFQDKNYFELIVGKENSPITLCHCINRQFLDENYKDLNVAEVCEILKKEKEVICKPSIDSGGGRGIIFLTQQTISKEKIAQLLSEYSGNFIIQRIIRQHEFLNQFNANALNTMRFVSFLHEGQVHILSAFLRIGGEDSRLDNVSSGGSYIQICSNGKLGGNVVRKDLTSHDLIKENKLSNGLRFEGLEIPQYDEIRTLIKNMHYKLAHFQIVNWDNALQENSIPIIVEYNLIDASAYFHQLNNGPIFGDLTEKVLKEVGGIV